jgi:3-methyl-2-oxobutanoate hydroxymethyltransferase
MNILDFHSMKKEGRKITMVTCYDHWSARIIEASDIDCVLVGDSVSMVVHGHPSTIHATTEMIALHTAAVARGLRTKFLVADMPFLSFRRGPEAALGCVEQLMRAGAHAVKLEGTWGHEEVVERIVRSGVPVMGHIGLTPQSVHSLGGFKVQGRDEETAQDLKSQARRLEELGCFALVLECVPTPLAREITESAGIPTIGIGAGPVTDGQVLVLQDLLGMNAEFRPRFLRHFLGGEAELKGALNRYHRAVVEKSYPNEQEAYL